MIEAMKNLRFLFRFVLRSFLWLMCILIILSIIGGKISAYEYTFQKCIPIDGEEITTTRRFSSRYLKKCNYMMTYNLRNETDSDLEVSFTYKNNGIEYIEPSQTCIPPHECVEILVKIRPQTKCFFIKTKYLNLIKAKFKIKTSDSQLEKTVILKESNFGGR